MKIKQLIKPLLFISISIVSVHIYSQSALVFPGGVILNYHGEYKELFKEDLTPDMIEWLEKALNNAGQIVFNQEIKDYLGNAINGCISESWKEIRKCPILEKYKDQFAKNLDNNYQIVFDPKISYMCQPWSKTIGCSTSYLKKMLNDIGEQLLEGKTPDVSSSRYPDFVDDIAHELIHMYGGVGGSEKEECEVHCITKNCFNNSHDPREGKFNSIDLSTNPPSVGQKDLQCQNEKYDEQTKKNMGEGQCFCGVDWKNKDKPVSEGCEPDSQSYGGGGGDHDDWADDNFSSAYGNAEKVDFNGFSSLMGFSGYFSDNYREFTFSYYPEILIYNKYEFYEMERLLNRSQADNFIDDYEHIDFSNEHKVLVVPSGELMGDRDSELIKSAFSRFVENGGTLLVLGQQYGEDVDRLVPIPDGECLQSYGWRQDQSCYNSSLYFRDMHPALSGLTDVRPTAGVDGYFPVYPSSSTILLRRISNQEPALLYYPYGNGTVILTSLYTDFGLAHSQASSEELRLVRDLFTFAKNTKLDIPMFDLAKDATPTINLFAKILNATESSATKMKFRISTPNRSRILFETEATIDLIGGAETTFPINFDLPVLTSDERGICHTDYELYSESGEIIQLAQESDEGRFAVYQYSGSVNTYRPLLVWITTTKEEWEWDEQGAVTIHVRNNTDNAITTDWYYQWNHQGHYILPETTIAAHSQVDLPINVDWPTWNSSGSRTLILFRLNYKQKDQSGDYFSIGKGLTVNLVGKGNINISAGSTSYKIGAPVGYSLSIYNSARRVVAGVNLRVAVEMKRWVENDYSEIKTIHQEVRDLEARKTYQYAGNYIQESGDYHPAGLYRLKLEITWPDGNKQYFYYLFSYVRSNITINLIETWVKSHFPCKSQRSF